MAPVSYLQTKISNIQSGAAPKWSGDDGKDVVAGLKTGLFSKLVPWHSTLDWRIWEFGWVELTNSGSLPVLFLSFIWNWRLVLSSHRIQLKVEPAVILTSPFSEYRMTLSRPASILKNCFLDFFFQTSTHWDTERALSVTKLCLFSSYKTMLCFHLRHWKFKSELHWKVHLPPQL